MPIYEYRCRDCSAEIELLVRTVYFRPPTSCAECGSKSVERKLANFAVARSELDRLRSMDPKYKQMVDDEMRKTESYAEPMKHLAKMIPMDAVDDPGDPVDF
jgi:putative FmdB family regulatory protein